MLENCHRISSNKHISKIIYVLIKFYNVSRKNQRCLNILNRNDYYLSSCCPLNLKLNKAQKIKIANSTSHNYYSFLTSELKKKGLPSKFDHYICVCLSVCLWFRSAYTDEPLSIFFVSFDR